VPADRREVVVAQSAQVRRQQRVERKPLARERGVDEQHVSIRIGADTQREREALVPVLDAVGGNSGSRWRDSIVAVALDLAPEAVRIGDDEAEIADLRRIDVRIKHLVHDAAAHREPHARGAQTRSHGILCAARPGRRDAGRSRCVVNVHSCRLRPVHQAFTRNRVYHDVGYDDIDRG
jgi:hypothetical protein